MSSEESTPSEVYLSEEGEGSRKTDSQSLDQLEQLAPVGSESEQKSLLFTHLTSARNHAKEGLKKEIRSQNLAASVVAGSAALIMAEVLVAGTDPSFRPLLCTIPFVASGALVATWENLKSKARGASIQNLIEGSIGIEKRLLEATLDDLRGIRDEIKNLYPPYQTSSSSTPESEQVAFSEQVDPPKEKKKRKPPPPPEDALFWRNPDLKDEERHAYRDARLALASLEIIRDTLRINRGLRGDLKHVSSGANAKDSPYDGRVRYGKRDRKTVVGTAGKMYDYLTDKENWRVLLEEKALDEGRLDGIFDLSLATAKDAYLGFGVAVGKITEAQNRALGKALRPPESDEEAPTAIDFTGLSEVLTEHEEFRRLNNSPYMSTSLLIERMALKAYELALADKLPRGGESAETTE